MDARVPVALLIGIVVGLVVAGFSASGVFQAGTAGETTPDPTPPHTVATGTGCYDGPRDNTGWVHVVADGRSWSVTLNATVVDAAGIDTNVSRRPTGGYEIALTTTGTTAGGTAGGDCRAATGIDLAAAMPAPEFVVTLEGRTVLSVDQAETTANLYPLANPLNATGDGR